jgi:hypothetical protein
MIKVHLLGNGLPHALPWSEEMGRVLAVCGDGIQLSPHHTRNIRPHRWDIRTSPFIHARFRYLALFQTSVQSIINSYAKNLYGTAFSCASNAL